MDASDRGSKHVCPECASKYYDLKRNVVACPRCGAKPLVEKAPKAVLPTKKVNRPTFLRYP